MAKKPHAAIIWDWPLRLWHWAFAGCIAFSLYTGLDGDIGLLEWHQRSGLALLGLVVFRIGWGLWGGAAARLGHYWTTPSAFIDHFRGRGGGTHTSPGIVLAVVLLAATALQVGSGLFVTDDIFNEGPLHRYVSAEFARGATWIHHRLHWLILGAAGIHLAAHAVYGFVLRDPTPLAMFTGRKPSRAPVPGPSRSAYESAAGQRPCAPPATLPVWLRAALTLALSAGVVSAVSCAERFLP